MGLPRRAARVVTSGWVAAVLAAVVGEVAGGAGEGCVVALVCAGSAGAGEVAGGGAAGGRAGWGAAVLAAVVGEVAGGAGEGCVVALACAGSAGAGEVAGGGAAGGRAGWGAAVLAAVVGETGEVAGGGSGGGSGGGRCAGGWAAVPSRCWKWRATSSGTRFSCLAAWGLSLKKKACGSVLASCSSFSPRRAWHLCHAATSRRFRRLRQRSTSRRRAASCCSGPMPRCCATAACCTALRCALLASRMPYCRCRLRGRQCGRWAPPLLLRCRMPAPSRVSTMSSANAAASCSRAAGLAADSAAAARASSCLCVPARSATAAASCSAVPSSNWRCCGGAEVCSCCAGRAVPLYRRGCC